jgi:hypothetical protein
MIDLSRNAELNAIFQAAQFLPQPNENALGDFVHCFLITTTCKKVTRSLKITYYLVARGIPLKLLHIKAEQLKKNKRKNDNHLYN